MPTRRALALNLAGLPRAGGEPLAPELSDFFEETLGSSLKRLRIHYHVRADRLNRQLGTLAFTHGHDVFFRAGAFAPRTPWGFWLLAHELTHVLQQRGGGSPSRARDARWGAVLEDEANRAAWALLGGRRVVVPPRPGCPPIQAAVPLLLLLAVAAAVALWPNDSIPPDPPKPTDPPLPRPSLYETGWGFVPVVGPLDQMINGKSWWSQIAGGVFFVMDVSVVGGLAVRGIRGVLFRLTGKSQAALRAAAEAGTETITRRSYEALVREGGAKAVTEAEASAMLKELGSAGQTALVVGAQSGKQGAFHSITYLIKDGRIYRLHGGIFRMAAGGEAMTVEKALAQGWNKGWNSLTVYSAKDLAARGITDEALTNVVSGWERRFPGMFGAIENVCSARGCANSQWLLMQQFGLPTNVSGLGRYVPLLMETSRISGNLGSHYVVNRVGAYGGTALQALLVGGLGASVRLADPVITALPNLLTQQVPSRADLTRAQLPTALVHQLDQMTQSENSVLMLPSDDVSFDPEDLAFPGGGQIIIDIPYDPLVEQDGSLNSGLRLPELGGAKRNSVPPGK
jgi:hypothetical protein